jgi:hypothetical protein
MPNRMVRANERRAAAGVACACEQACKARPIHVPDLDAHIRNQLSAKRNIRLADGNGRNVMQNGCVQRPRRSRFPEAT